MSQDSVYDVVIIGGGGIGSATAYRLGKLYPEKKVAVLEQFDILHRNGSSSGESRIIRRTYMEASYARLMPPAYKLWDELQRDSGTTVITTTGGLDFGAPDDPGLRDMLESCRRCNVEHEILTAQEAMAKFPAFTLQPHWKAVYTTQGGVVNPDKSINCFINQAKQRGVDIRTGVKVTGIERGDPQYVTLLTNKGSIRAEKVVVTPGPWANRMFSLLNLHVTHLPIWKLTYGFWPVEDKYQSQFTPDNFPVWIHYRKPEEGGVMYGFPVLEEPGCIKVPPHETPHRVDPETRTFAPNSDLIEKSRGFIHQIFPGKAGHKDPKYIQTCLYTMTPDHHCIVDSHPLDPRILIGAGFHGEGFKLATVMGDILARWAVDGRPPLEYDISAFNIQRVLKTPASRL